MLNRPLAAAVLCAVVALAPAAPADAKKKPKPKPKPHPAYTLSFQQTRVIKKVTRCPNDGGTTVTTATDTLSTNENGSLEGKLHVVEDSKLDYQQVVEDGNDPSADGARPDVPPGHNEFGRQAEEVVSIHGTTVVFTHPGLQGPARSTSELPKKVKDTVTTPVDEEVPLTERGRGSCVYYEGGNIKGSYTITRTK